MTCIVGLVDKGKVYMGGDSLSTAGSHIVHLHPKIFKIGSEFIIGTSGSVRTAQLLEFSFLPPAHNTGDANDRYMASTFANSLRDCLKNNDVTWKKEGEEQATNLYFLVGYRKQLFKVWSNFTISFPHNDYEACGSGCDYALGALSVLPKNLPAKKKILLALEAAEKWNTGVRRPFTILSI
jgi:ATP-dependent protease HslVU (ClpYQ) peptidase subunit